MNDDIPPRVTTLHKLTHSWLASGELRTIAQRVGTPVFIYSEKQLLKNVARIQNAAADAGIASRVELYIPFFPNSNPHVLKPLQSAGVGLLVQLPSEYKILRRFGFEKFIVSPGHVSDDDIGAWAQTGYPIFLSSLGELSHLMRTDQSASINIRLDSLSSSKPGIKYGQLQDVADLLARHGRELDCFEMYCGSGNSVDDMISVIEQVLMIFRTYFPHAKSINFAGGYGFLYDEWSESAKHFEWGKYFKSLRAIADRYQVPDHVKFLFEPARDVLGDVGALLLGVKRNTISRPGGNQVLTNGSRVLLPSAQYKGRRHNVLFLNRQLAELEANPVRAALRGRSILRHDYVLPGDYWVPDIIGSGDYALILDVGAYCATQHMEFLNIPPAAEVLVEASGAISLITAHGGDLDKWRHLLPEKQSLQNL